MKKLVVFCLGLLMSCLALAQTKVVYHLSEGIPQATRAIGNIRNHLAADPDVKIVVVTHGAGIDFCSMARSTRKSNPLITDCP